jgi:hypothetical protein
MNCAVAPNAFVMKTTLCLSLALLMAAAAQAQIFGPQPVNGSVLGNGRGSGRETQGHSPRGGEYIYRDRPSDRFVGHQGYGYRGRDDGHGFYGRSRFYDRSYYGGVRFGYYPGAYGYSYVPSFGYYSGYGYGYPYYDTAGYYGYGSGAANGLLLGALAGGIIGNNSGDFRHNGWRGAAWGAGAGWLLGSIFDANRRAAVYQPAPVVYQPATVQAQVQPAAPTQPQQVTIINNYYNASTPMTAANGMFGR